MTEALALDLLRQSFWVALQVAGPPLAVALIVGVAVSLFAAITQIQEMTLTFVPKALAMGVVVWLLGPWMLKVLVSFAIGLFKQVSTLGPGAP